MHPSRFSEAVRGLTKRSRLDRRWLMAQARNFVEHSPEPLREPAEPTVRICFCFCAQLRAESLKGEGERVQWFAFAGLRLDSQPGKISGP